MSGLRINISKLSEGIHSRSLEIEPSGVDLDTRFNTPVKIDATLEKSTKQIYLTAQVVTAGVFACDRCLDEYRREVEARYSLVYMFGSEQGLSRDEHEVELIHPDTSFIDIGDDVRQFLLLAIPQKLLCNDDCKGLCPTCGVNRNRTVCECEETKADPRWQGLRKFLEN